MSDKQDFREEGGRRYQTANEHYPLPADDPEFARLDRQHLGLKTLYGGRNYVAPVRDVLGQDSAKDMVKRGIDVGSGSGIWALEMAKEFPEVQWTGLDLFAIERRPSQPSNVEYVKGNVLTGLDFPDGHFDIVHARHLITAVQNWRPVIDELVRITKPGGLIISVEICFPITVYNGTEEDTLKLAPGFAACHNVFMAAFKARGTDLLPGYTVATLLREHASVKETGQLESIFPFTPCTDDPNAIEAGRIMKENVLSMPESTRQIFMSKPGVTEEQFQQIKAGFTNDIERGIPLAAKLWHNWAWRR